MKSSPRVIFTILARLTRAVVVLLSVSAPLASADEAAGRETTGVERKEVQRKESTPFPILKSESDPARFDFETDVMRGTIQLEGAYHGVTRLVDKATGRQVIDERYSALNFFKLMSVNLVMGEPRTMERTIRSGAHWVEVKWSATESHLADLTARYEVVEPHAIELTLTVRSQGTYPAYEVFMPNYFDKSFRPYIYLWSRGRQESELVLPRVNDVFRDTLLVFPRDGHVARRCIDGRWDRREWGRSTIQMCPVRHYAHCLAFMADEEEKLGVVLMSQPRDCYAFSTRYHADTEADRLTTYSAFDLSLFGDDLLPGDERSVKVRLAITALDRDMSQPLKLYRSFISEMNDLRDPPTQPSPEGVTP